MRWPANAIFICSIVEVFEEIVTGLVEQENFTNLTFVGDDLIFTAESVGKYEMHVVIL